MIEKEFKDYLSLLELNQATKKDYSSITKNIIDLIKSNLDKNIKLFDIYQSYTDNLINREREINIVLKVELKNKSLPFKVFTNIIMNEIETIIYLNMKNNLLSSTFNNSIRIIDDNTLIMFFNDFKIIFKIYFSKESIIKTDIIDTHSNYIIQEEIEEDYFKSIQNRYSKFNSTINILKGFMRDENCKSLKDSKHINRILYYLLSYSLNTYCDNESKEINSYIFYLSTFEKGLKDLLDKITIKPTNDLFNKYKLYGNITQNGRYKIIPICNMQENIILFADDDSTIINDLKSLRSKIISSLPKDGKYVTIICNPNYVIKGKTIEWCFKIEGCDVSNNGGEYEYNSDNYYMCIYRALLKGLQFVCKNKLGNNIIIKCTTLDPFKREELSYENDSRFANILTFIKDNNLSIEYKLYE